MPEPVPHYVTTAAGQVRLWLCGSGPNLVALAGPTVTASILARRLTALCPGWRIVAAEMPGIGGSAGIDPQSVDQCADALGEALGWIGGEPSVVLGSELAAAVALALADRLPRRPEAILLAGLESARAWQGAGIRPPDLEPKQDGTHLQALWSFLRDRHLLEPANPGQPATRGEPLPTEAELSETFVASAVRPDRFARLWVCCLDGLGAAPGRAIPLSLLEEVPAQLARLAPAPAVSVPPRTAPMPQHAVWHDYVETPRGRFHLRRAGSDGTPLLVIPTGGGSSAQFAPVISGLADGRQVFAVDYPGNGLSFKPEGRVTIESLAGDMAALLDAMGLDRVDVWGSHTGALVGLELAVTAPRRVGRLVMEGPVFISADFQADLLANYFPPIRPDKWGLHLPLVWNWRRDLFMFWPWYRVDRAAARQLGVPDAWELHKYAIGILESGETYDGAYRSAFSYDTRARLPLLTRSGLVCAGPNDMLKDGLSEARRLGPPGLEVTETPTTVWWPDPDPAEARRTMALYDRFLRR